MTTIKPINSRSHSDPRPHRFKAYLKSRHKFWGNTIEGDFIHNALADSELADPDPKHSQPPISSRMTRNADAIKACWRLWRAYRCKVFKWRDRTAVDVFKRVWRDEYTAKMRRIILEERRQDLKQDDRPFVDHNLVHMIDFPAAEQLTDVEIEEIGRWFDTAFDADGNEIPNQPRHPSR